jgi:CO/xanthine dehydrogenase FAD-binding subunit
MGKGWSIDVDGSLQAVLDDGTCPPVLRQALTGALSWQVRNEVTVRRALSSPRIAPLWTTALYALGATVTVEEDGKQSEVALAEAGSSRLVELQVEVEGLRWGEAHVARTPADEPIVAAVAAVRLEGGVVQEARVALTGVWQQVAGLAEAPAQLEGKELNDDSIQAVAEAVEQEVTPKGDFLGSEQYRRAMAGVLTRRALQVCLEQEAGNEQR